MKNLKTTLPALALCGAMLLSLASCREKGITTEDASQCVQVEMDTTYKGIYDGFVDFYENVTTQDAREQHDSNLTAEAQYFFRAFGAPTLDDSDTTVEPSEMQLHRAKEIYGQIYAKSDYTITSSSKQDDGTFAVKMTVKPMNIMELVNQCVENETGFEDFYDKYGEVDLESMAEEELSTWYDNFVSDYYDTLLSVLGAQIPNIGYEEEKSIVVQVIVDEDTQALYISSDDLHNLDDIIINYNF